MRAVVLGAQSVVTAVVVAEPVDRGFEYGERLDVCLLLRRVGAALNVARRAEPDDIVIVSLP